jgi:hypothetical protein
MRSWDGRRRRFSGRREVAIGLGVYAVYLLVARRAFANEGRVRAAANAARVVALERRLGIHFEPELQRLALPHRRLVQILNGGYATLNVGLTVGWLMRLFFRRDPAFHRFRRAALVTILGAQPAFLWFPTAPPRSLEHMVDTIAELWRFDLDSGLISKLYHPLAAMPSIHVAFAVVTASAVSSTAPTLLVRLLAPWYAPGVTAVVFVTGNHYVLDAVAGAALGGAGLAIARWMES